MNKLTLSLAITAACHASTLSALELSENSYVSINPNFKSASVLSLSDNNVITAGDRTLELDLYERGVFHNYNDPAITPGMVITGTGPFDLGSIRHGTDTPVHASMQGTVFAMPHSRFNQTYHMISPQGDATVEINVGGDVYQRTLPEGEPVNFETGQVDVDGSTVITSDLPILVSHSAILRGGKMDATPMPPADTEIWGLCSYHAVVSATEDDTQVTIYNNYRGTGRDITLNAGEKEVVCNFRAMPDHKQGQGPAVHIVADKPVSAIQFQDGDGRDMTAFYPTSLLNSRFGIPKDSQYVAVTCPSENTDVTLYRPDGTSESQNCSANGNIPDKAYFGNGDANGTHIVQGSYIESSNPIHVTYEVTGSEDEHNLVGTGPHSTPPPSSNGFFSWDVENVDVGELNRRTPGQPFDDVNRYARITTDIVDTVPGSACHSGNRCMRLGYTQNESGVELQVNDLMTRAGGQSKSLYTRKYEYYGDEWQGNWPIGLKTSRYFTDVRGGNAAYMSEKLIYQTYGGEPTDLYGRGLNNSIGGSGGDQKAVYGPEQLFGNGLPYIRTGHWYKYETWMVLNSGLDVNDGVLQVWIDDVLVYSDTSVAWLSSQRGITQGGNYWEDMWFGGNYTGADWNSEQTPRPSETVYRYIDDLYLSTTLDR